MKHIRHLSTATLFAYLLVAVFVPASANAQTVEDKYNLHSYYVERLDGKVIDNYRGDAPPKEATSLLKPILADIAIRSNGDLNRKIRLSSIHMYGCNTNNNHKVGQVMSLKKAIYLTLRQSDNVAANALITFSGGLGQVNAAVHTSFGPSYQSTRVVSYYNCSGGDNATSAKDVSLAMRTIFTSNSKGYTIARSALKGAAKNNYWQVQGVYADKYGATSQVSGNSAIVKRGGKKYIVTVYINQLNAKAAIQGSTYALANKARSIDSSR